MLRLPLPSKCRDSNGVQMGTELPLTEWRMIWTIVLTATPLGPRDFLVAVRVALNVFRGSMMELTEVMDGVLSGNDFLPSGSPALPSAARRADTSHLSHHLPIPSLDPPPQCIHFLPHAGDLLLISGSLLSRRTIRPLKLIPRS